MPHSKRTIYKLLFTIALMITAPVQKAAAAKMIDATQVGVVGDGTTLNTATIQKAIDQCSATGGRILSFSRGRYLTGADPPQKQRHLAG